MRYELSDYECCAPVALRYGEALAKWGNLQNSIGTLRCTRFPKKQKEIPKKKAYSKK